MKRTKQQLTAFKVKQAIGSLAIEGIQVSRESEALMLRIANGRASGSSAKEALIAKYRQSTSTTA